MIVLEVVRRVYFYCTKTRAKKDASIRVEIYCKEAKHLKADILTPATSKAQKSTLDQQKPRDSKKGP